MGTCKQSSFRDGGNDHVMLSSQVSEQEEIKNI